MTHDPKIENLKKLDEFSSKLLDSIILSGS